MITIKYIIKSQTIVITQENIEELLMIFAIQNTKHKKKIPVVFHNGSTYDYLFIVKELAKEFEGQFECLGENTEKYTTFSVPLKKRDNGKRIIYKIKFIDSFRFMSSSLSSLVDNLSEVLHNYKCTSCKSCFDYISTKDSQLIFKCTECTKKNKDLIKRFEHMYEFCDRDIDKFILLLKVVSATFLLVCFICLNERTCKTRKNVFYFTSRAFFVLEIIRF